MFYTAKYCGECGEKNDRVKRGWLTSRRFCETCESELKRYDWARRGVFGVGLLLALFGIGSFLKKPDKPLNVTTAPLASIAENVNQTARSSPPNANAQNPAQTLPAANTAVQPGAAANSNPKPAPVKRVSPESGQNSASETVYFCGAQTKKGTACTRRVKSPGRCWQHEGQSAILPPDKLVASR